MIDGFVLAGGQGRRMGLDKARLAWDGVPLAAVVAQALATCCGRVSLVRRADDGLPWGRWPVVYEPPHSGTHPLYGVAAALAESRTANTVIAACDLPYLEGAHLEAMLPGPARASCEGQAHALLAIVPSRWAPKVLAAAQAGASVRSVLGVLPAVDIPTMALRNVNRPEDRPHPGPVRTLLEGLPWLDPADLERIAAGERLRLAAQGMVDVRYPSARHTGEGE